jgi:hypothetical protein
MPLMSRIDDDEESEDSEKENDCCAQTNFFGVNFLMWFEVGIEGKNPMDEEEEDRGGKVEFWYQGKMLEIIVYIIFKIGDCYLLYFKQKVIICVFMLTIQ